MPQLTGLLRLGEQLLHHGLRFRRSERKSHPPEWKARHQLRLRCQLRGAASSALHRLRLQQRLLRLVKMVGDLFRSAPTSRFDVGAGQTLVYAKAAHDTHLMPNMLVRVLDLCATFRSLDEHADHVARALRSHGSDGDGGEVRRALEELA